MARMPALLATGDSRGSCPQPGSSLLWRRVMTC